MYRVRMSQLVSTKKTHVTSCSSRILGLLYGRRRSYAIDIGVLSGNSRESTGYEFRPLGMTNMSLADIFSGRRQCLPSMTWLYLHN